MTYKTHRLIGLTLAVDLCIATSASATTSAVVIATSYATSDWADRLEPDDAMTTGQHRQVTHWPETGLLLAAITYLAMSFFAPPFAVAIATGVLIGHWGGHLLADGCTRGAIPNSRLVLWIARALGKRAPKTIHLLPKWARVYVRSLREKILVRGLVTASLIAVVVMWANALTTPNHGDGALGPLLRSLEHR